ncbi:ROK family protein [Oharaeibacter diazotrophicus]|uniref:Glucokinase n=3 Tax=Oharaeibacter diazotrophicus TaxID=1920512 RepID=A0A4R6RKT8_9HYPH|nr:ROK family protein [Oharaeibacter diazotrophicus]TDP87223.1 glucokinase [Oharaeibacter diazotrophicus]BBE70834.1 beta-glucoside kinase [Pleomorphomonas sp. SM30]GLS77583.1 hypothetical protein GCM10007904_29200 [Oharaeibacter diazotrophicus]
MAAITTAEASSGRVPGAGDAGTVVGIDLGGSKILGGVADLSGRLLADDEEPTRHGPDAPFLDQIAAMVDRLHERAGRDRTLLSGVVVGVPGTVSPETGLVALSPNLALPADEPVGALIARRVGCPVEVLNDVAAAAYGEAMRGGGDGRGLIAFAAFGTGVGLGLVLDGRILHGARGRAGEIAYLPIGADPHEAAPASASGLFEDRVGSAAIRARYGADAPSVAVLFDRAAAGDARAAAVLDDVARDAATGLAAVVALLDPDALVLGGSIGVRPEFAGRVGLHMNRLLPFEVDLRTSALGRAAGMLGAVHAAAETARADAALLAGRQP